MSDAAFERFVIEMKTIMSLKIPGGVKITNYTLLKRQGPNLIG